MDNPFENTLRRLDDAALSASLELEKAMHIAGNLVDYFDLRDEAALTSGMAQAIVTNYKDAGIDSDIVHDYLIQANKHLKELRSALDDLFNQQEARTK